jgi:hypothetical protein
MIKTTCAVVIAISAAMVPTSAQDRPARSEQPAAPAPVAPLAPLAPLAPVAPPAPLAPLPADEGRQSWTLSMVPAGPDCTSRHTDASS